MLVLGLLVSAQSEAPIARAAAAADRAPAVETFLRTELYFGTARPDLPPVTSQEWKDLLDRVITEEFPEGLTVLGADGQYQDRNETIVREKTYVLVLFYPENLAKAKSDSIEFIREAYEQMFQQESVMRVDYPAAIQVSF